MNTRDFSFASESADKTKTLKMQFGRELLETLTQEVLDNVLPELIDTDAIRRVVAQYVHSVDDADHSYFCTYCGDPIEISRVTVELFDEHYAELAKFTTTSE